MKLIDLMLIVSDAYDVDGTLNLCIDMETGMPLDRKDREDAGDTLAEFVAVEIAETFDPEESDFAQLSEASRVIETAKHQLQAVENAIDTEWGEVNRARS